MKYQVVDVRNNEVLFENIDKQLCITLWMISGKEIALITSTRGLKKLLRRVGHNVIKLERKGEKEE